MIEPLWLVVLSFGLKGRVKKVNEDATLLYHLFSLAYQADQSPIDSICFFQYALLVRQNGDVTLLLSKI